MKVYRAFLGLLFMGRAALCHDETPPFVLVSDIDDTVKITHVKADHKCCSYRDLQEYYEMLENGFYGKDVFLGMPELYQEFAARAKAVIYLSGSPQSLTESIQELFQQKALPGGLFVLNNWWNWESTGPFKSQALAGFEKEKQYQGSSFLLIGDDTESDPAVMSEFRKTHPERIQEVYIHQVTGAEIPGNTVAYNSAFDIALREVEKGRLKPAQARKVGEAILAGDHLDKLFPGFVKVCPSELSFPPGEIGSSDPELLAVSNMVRAFIRDYCSHRIQE